MADVLAPTLILLGLLLTLPAAWLLLRALFPGCVERTRARLHDGPGTSFALGIPVAGVLLVAPLVMLNRGGPPAKALGFLLFLGGFLLVGIGLAGLADLVGARLASPHDEGRPWRAQVRGAVCLVLSFLLPLVGWFGILPLAAVTSIGAAALSLRRGGPGEEAAADGGTTPVAAGPAA